MPTYQMQAPDGKTYRIQGPPGASDDEVKQAIIAQYPHLSKTESKEQTWRESIERGLSRIIPQAREIVSGIPDAISNIPGAIQRTFDPVNIAMGRSPVFQKETYGAIARAPVERYGTAERAKETIATDPLGALMDVSLVGSAAGTALRQIPKTAKLGEMLEKGAQVVDPLTVASRVVTKVPREVLKFRFGAPDTSEIRAMKDAAYQQSEQAGAVFNPTALQVFATDVKQNVNFNPKNNPKIANLIEDIDETVKTPQSLRQVDELRQRIKDVEASVDPADRFLAAKLREKLDDFVDDSLQDPTRFVMGQPDIAIPALQEARRLNAQMRKSETLERLLSIADVRASGYTASGLENAIRAQIREFVKDPKAKKLRGFSKEEIDALREVAEGGSITNIMRMAGRFTPTGPVSSLPVGLVGGIDPATGVMMAGGAVTGRIGATGGTKYAVQQAGQLIRGGTTASQKLADMLSRYGDKLSAVDPSMKMAVDMTRRTIAAGKKVDPYYARQLAAQLARIEAEEQEQGQ